LGHGQINFKLSPHNEVIAMCKYLAGRIILLFLFSIPVWSQTEDHSWEAYIQGSRANTNLLLDAATSGLHLGAAWEPARPFGLVGDFGLQRGSREGRSIGYSTIMAGPRLSTGEIRNLSAFVQGLGGVYRTSGASLFPEERHWSYILSVGGGVDMRIINPIAVRLLQIDLALPRGPAGGPVGVATVSAGVVFRIGH
jgi:hypothetical protein